MARLWFMDRPKFGRSCLDCRTYQFDEDTGRPAPDRRKSHAGLPMMRPKRADPPCHTCPKTIGLAARHWRGLGEEADPPDWCYRAFRHWRENKASGWAGPPPDKITRRNAAMFQAVEDAIAAGRADGVLTLFGMLKARGG